MSSWSTLFEEESVRVAFWPAEHLVEGLAPPASQLFWTWPATTSGNLPGPHFLSKNVCGGGNFLRQDLTDSCSHRLSFTHDEC